MDYTDTDTIDELLMKYNKNIKDGIPRSLKIAFLIQSIIFFVMGNLLLFSPHAFLLFFGWKNAEEELLPRLTGGFFIINSYQTFIMCRKNGSKNSPYNLIGECALATNIGILCIFSFGIINNYIDFEGRSSFPGLFFISIFIGLSWTWAYFKGSTNLLSDAYYCKIRQLLETSDDIEQNMSKKDSQIKELTDKINKKKKRKPAKADLSEPNSSSSSDKTTKKIDATAVFNQLKSTDKIKSYQIFKLYSKPEETNPAVNNIYITFQLATKEGIFKLNDILFKKGVHDFILEFNSPLLDLLRKLALDEMEPKVPPKSPNIVFVFNSNSIQIACPPPLPPPLTPTPLL